MLELRGIRRKNYDSYHIKTFKALDLQRGFKKNNLSYYWEIYFPIFRKFLLLDNFFPYKGKNQITDWKIIYC